MGTAIAVTPLASAKQLGSPIFSIYRGEESFSERSDVSLYLPTQILSIADKRIVAPGAISLRLEGGNAVVTDASGGVRELLRNAITGAVSVPFDLIRKNKKMTAPTGNLGDETLTPSFFIRRAVAYAEEVSVEMREVDALRARATTTARELLGGEAGRAFVYFATRTDKRTDRTVPAWDDRKTKKKYYRIGVLVERSVDGEFFVADCIKENRDLISEECRSPKLPGEDFRNLDYPLGGFLRKLQKIFSAAAKGSKKKSEFVESELSFWQKMLEGAGEEKTFDADEWRCSVDNNQSVYVNAVIVDEESGLFLFVHKYDDGKPSWGLPGGGREPGETAEDALFREVEWESGLRIYRGCINNKLVGVQKIVERLINAHHKRISFYSPFNSRIFTPSMKGVKERNEINRVGLFSLEDFLKMTYFPWDRFEADSDVVASFGYRKQLHTDDVITTLRLLGKLNHFGFREATRNDVIEFVLKGV